MKNFHKMVTPPPYCICEILFQIFTVNERKVICDWNKQKFGEEKLWIFHSCFTTSGSNPPGGCTSNFWGIGMDSYGRESLRKIKSWCGQLLCLPRLIHRTFLFQKMYCQEEGKDTDEVSLVCWGALQFLILLRRMIDTSSGWVNPWFEALVRGLALLSACTVDFSGCQVDRDKSMRVWFFHPISQIFIYF